VPITAEADSGRSSIVEQVRERLAELWSYLTSNQTLLINYAGNTANTIDDIGCCSFAAHTAAYAAFGPRFEKLWELCAPDTFVLK
jgi:hypothetical protein